MAENENNKSFFLLWPDFQKTFEGQDKLLDVMKAYQGELKRISEIFMRLRNYNSEEWVENAKARFNELAKKFEKKGKEQKATRYKKLARTWTVEKNIGLVESIYEESIKLVDRYITAYEDFSKRQKNTGTRKTNSIVTPFIKSLYDPVYEDLNYHMRFESRLKTWYSFIQKLITRAEMLDLKELLTYYDIYGIKAIISNGIITRDDEGNHEDYFNAENDCYKCMNTLIHQCMSAGAKPIGAKLVGATSESIWEEYRPFVKDYISNPKENGYKALHASFEITINRRKFFFEIQVCSQLMALKSKTQASHKKYKKDSKLDLEFDSSKVLIEGYTEDVCDGEIIIEDVVGLLKPLPLTKPRLYDKL